ncbi:MAG: hypothetical protein ABI970_10320 [Chloroflexota bacterium]
MTSFRLPSAIFPDNAITRAEHTYQTRSARKFRTWRRWINRTVMWLAIALSLIHFLGLLVASLTLRDPSPITRLLNPLPNLLLLFASFYHLYLMFQTIVLSSNSITREKEFQTWELLVLTGINARQIVRGKWWATVQRQVPYYLRLAVLRIGATAALAISFAAIFSYRSNYYQSQFQLPHPLTLVIAALLAVAFTFANLALSAACGVMGSAVSKRSTFAIARGIANQIVISCVPALVVFFVITRPYFYTISSPYRSIYTTLTSAIFSLVDNGVNLLASPMYPGYLYNDTQVYTPYAPIAVDWMIAAVICLALYVLLIWFALWRAEKRTVSALATPVDSKSRIQSP